MLRRSADSSLVPSQAVAAAGKQRGHVQKKTEVSTFWQTANSSLSSSQTVAAAGKVRGLAQVGAPSEQHVPTVADQGLSSAQAVDATSDQRDHVCEQAVSTIRRFENRSSTQPVNAASKLRGHAHVETQGEQDLSTIPHRERTRRTNCAGCFLVMQASRATG